ncbi:MAG: hypothetical protein ACOYLC_01925 [Armatimonadaceae bacterium]
MSLQIWTPEQGASGLIIIPKPTPILIVTGGRVDSWTPQQVSPTEPTAPVEVHRTSGGILIVKQRPAKPRRIIGHPELAMGATVRKDDTLYVSISEAIYRQHQGEEVELHFTSTSDDDRTLSYTKQQVWKQWDEDTLPDGWTRPRSTSPNARGKFEQNHIPAGIPSPSDPDLTSALERLRSLRGS